MRRFRMPGLVVLSCFLPALAFADVTLTMSGAGPYLRVDPTDVAGSPRIVPLADYGFAPGSTLRITPLGDFHNGIDGDIHTPMFAVFSASSVLLAPNLQQRVAGALDAGTDTNSGLTCPSGLPTDIAEDFFVPVGGVEVVIPAGATHLFIQPVECYFIDNSDPDGDYAVSLAAPATGVSGRPIARLALAAPRPNPARGETRVQFSLASGTAAEIEVLDVQGRCVLRQSVPAAGAGGARDVRLQTGGLRAGAYQVRVHAGGRSESRPLTIVR